MCDGGEGAVRADSYCRQVERVQSVPIVTGGRSRGLSLCRMLLEKRGRFFQEKNDFLEAIGHVQDP